MTTYKVGQVLYAVLRKEAMVFPIQVVEEVVRRTMDGEATTYMVRAGADPKKIVAINEVDGEVFDNSEAAKAMLVERATRAICQRVDQAVAKAKEWYPGGHEAQPEDALTMLTKQETHVSDSAPPRKPTAQSKRSTASMKPEVAMLAAEFAAESNNAAETFVQLPDGSKAKIGKIKLPVELQG